MMNDELKKFVFTFPVPRPSTAALSGSIIPHFSTAHFSTARFSLRRRQTFPARTGM
jgi:hypothetical protein